jgi:hypothetical protein
LKKEDESMNLRDLKIDPVSLGKTLLVDVKPGYQYKDGVRTDVCSHYVYSVTLPKHCFDKMNIKIDGKQIMQKPDEAVEVTFEALELYIYMQNGQPIVAGRATGIEAVSSKKA